jgi:hypothetical protein
MITSRRLLPVYAAAALASSRLLRASAQATPEVDESVSGVVTVTTPVVLDDGIIIDHYRVAERPSNGDVVILGSITNGRDDTVAIPSFDFDVNVRDRDGVILGSTYADPVYPAVAPGASIGFVAWVIDVPFADVDPLGVSFEAGDFESNDSVLDQLAEATVEIESQQEISRVEDLQIEFIVRNTSDLNYDGLTPKIAVWDANSLFCGNAYANVFTTVPAGDAIKFTTHSYAGSFNPLDIAGDDFTLEPWIVPIVV